MTKQLLSQRARLMSALLLWLDCLRSPSAGLCFRVLALSPPRALAYVECFTIQRYRLWGFVRTGLRHLIGDEDLLVRRQTGESYECRTRPRSNSPSLSVGQLGISKFHSDARGVRRIAREAESLARGLRLSADLRRLDRSGPEGISTPVESRQILVRDCRIL